MKAIQMLAVTCALALSVPTVAVAKRWPTKVEPVRAARIIPPPVVVCPCVILTTQDLFDRNNPINLRNDYPAPPGQPAQF